MNILIIIIMVMFFIIIKNTIKIKKLQDDIKTRDIIEEKIREKNNYEQTELEYEETYRYSDVSDREYDTNNQIIMIVDDNEHVLDIVSSLLRGYKSKSFDKPYLALDFLKNNHNNVNIVITDYSMPGDFDGIDFIKKIKSIDSDISIIVITGFNYIEVNPEDKHLIDKYLVKPLNREKIIKAIEDIKKGI